MSGRKAFREQTVDDDARSDAALQHVGHAVDQRQAIDALQLQFLPSGKGEHALRQGGAPVCRSHGIVQETFYVAAFGKAHPGQLETTDDHGKQIIEVMRDAAR